MLRSSSHERPSICGCIDIGTQSSGRNATSVPWKSRGATPRTVYDRPLMRSVASRDVRVATKSTLPGVEAQDRIRGSSARGVFLGREEPADGGAQPQHLKVVARGKVAPRAIRASAGLQTHRRDPIRRDIDRFVPFLKSR